MNSKAFTRLALGRLLLLVHCWVLAGHLAAQPLTTLHTFSSLTHLTNIDGAHPQAGLVLSSNTLFGTTGFGGSSFSTAGTVFSVKTDGTGFTVLHSFNGSDGANPYASLVLSGNTLYGTTEGGGSTGNGTVFAVNIDGSDFRLLHSFLGLNSVPPDGAQPQGGLVQSGNTLYGTTSGTVYKINTDGTGFTNLHILAVAEGDRPMGELSLVGDTLFGTTPIGGSGNGGTVFSLNTNGTGFKPLHEFNGNDGKEPLAGVVVSGNALYGTTGAGGGLYAGGGTVFKVNIDGTGFSTLYNFTALGAQTNSDGFQPNGLVLSGNNLYGTARLGGIGGGGTVFALNTDGTGFTVVRSFVSNVPKNFDGAFPYGSLIVAGNRLYGTTYAGGISKNGMVFSISFTPQLTISGSGANLILSWPTNYVGFDYTGFSVESTTNLASPFWTTNPPPPVVVNGQNTVTSPISSSQQFFRLSQ